MLKYLKNLKLIFLVVLAVFSFLIAFIILMAKDNFYFTARYAEMNFNYLKYEALGVIKLFNTSYNDKSLITKSIPVFFYHGIVNNEDGLDVTISKFKDQIFNLKKNGYQTVTINDFYKFINGEKEFAGKSFVIAFDGGKKDTYYYADPLLKALDYNAVMFMPTYYIGNSKFYLDANDLKRMVKSNRWEVQSNSRKSYESAIIGFNTEEGYFLGNKLYVKDKNRLENDKEYKIRIEEDLLTSKKDIETITGITPIIFSLPIINFGKNSINYKEAENIIVGSAKNIFQNVFSEFWPKNKYGFKTNYPYKFFSSNLLKGILVNPKWSGKDIVDFLEASQSINLPYKEKFINKNKWNSSLGSVSITDENLIIKKDNGDTANVYLDGSEKWGNYEYNIEIVGNLGKNTKSVSLIARSNNNGNYVSCQFEKDSVVIKSSNNEKISILNSVNINKLNQKGDNNLKIVVYDDFVQCFINSESIAKIKNSSIPSYGGIGIKIWGNNEKNDTLIIKNLEAISIDSSNNASVLSNIYYNYPLFHNGKEAIYSFIDNGSVTEAEYLLNDEYKISRFELKKLSPVLTWKEDPYNEPYWRFNFYNLEPARNLLFAWRKTGNQKYLDKLISITESFVDNGMNGPYSWDYHGTAFRTMTLVDIFWKLREDNRLLPNFGFKILKSLKIHGDFLADEVHYEKDYNHGLDQATALYALAINFPDLPGANNWRLLAEKRLNDGISEIIDQDGVLVENSPYYHFYVLEKYWEINKFLKKFKLTVGNNFDEKINKMIFYATYILQPDLKIPTIGASLERQINLIGVYEEMAKDDPEFKYVLTQGKSGKKPAFLSKFYPVAGQTIMRSGWNDGKSFENQTQVIFDVGNYRTNHSDLDALSFNLFGKGMAFMPDAGLYIYEEGPYRAYFHGTRAHNTVVVDKLDQTEGKLISGNVPNVVAGQFYNGNGFSYQSAQNTLYDGVIHKRSVALIEDKLVLVIDDLSSNEEHTYEQMFHAFPGAKIDVNNKVVKIFSDRLDQTFTIHQLADPNLEAKTVIGQNSPFDGWCSTQYKIAVPCYSISYEKKTKTAFFVTSIKIGQSDNVSVKFDKEKNILIAKIGDKEYQIKISKTKKIGRAVEVNKKYDISELLKNSTILDYLDDWKIINPSNKGSAIVEKEPSTAENTLKITTPDNGSIFELQKNIQVDLSDKNLFFKLKISNRKEMKGIKIFLSNNYWKNAAIYNLGTEAYNTNFEDDWLTIGLGKNLNKKVSLGSWDIKYPGFDWSKIDGVKFSIQANQEKTVVVEIRDLSTIFNQKNGRVIIVFDDGWESIKDAANIMNKFGLKGNIGVITNSVGKKNYLNLDDLKFLQNEYGWSIANHSSLHKNAVEFYYKNNNLEGFEKDIIDAMQYLIKNGINSAPNWYIYPHGETNATIKNIVGKYYKFARGTQDIPEFFPFTDPLSVKVFSAYSDRTTVKDINDAILDAIKYKQILFLMFHKISEREMPQVHTEYTQANLEIVFKNIADYVSRGDIKVVTLTELDEENNIPATNFVVHDEIPSQIILNILISKK